MRLLPTPLLLAALLSLSQCKKSDSGPAKPEDQLPPATQTGAGTFGCLLNGQPWTPSGYDGKPNFITTYDSGYAGGNLAIRVYRLIPSAGTNQYFLISSTSVNKTGVYNFDNNGPAGAYYNSGINGNCQEYGYYIKSNFSMDGQLTVTRLDQKAGIIAGTFNFKLYQPGCDTIKATQGRFDYQL
ncbi:hypothetical protein E4631_01905 [Hymenobacter sp. UV11]|uniref:hypothetical protein n=1 Tax=Hymenobacter sp. UV11 TaxID=1849735 RepID=UPI00106108F4|nr:hypothetical protein [Hymenobacter sp. UV11]TDN37642.1 hypothetical protein A8B98_03735 [Hymenobacter sp. UV11]TFZ68840.1 hypothetical protein E4631_01905 [Hymenobacter sp. UV11]